MTAYYTGAVCALVLAAIVAVVIVALLTRKPRIRTLCGQVLQCNSTRVAECSLTRDHSGVHGARSGDNNVWWSRSEDP